MISLSQHMRPAEIDALNEINKMFVYKQPTAITGIEIENGGYMQVGNLVFIDLEIKQTTSTKIDAGTEIITGLPDGISSVSPLFACDAAGVSSNLFYFMNRAICPDFNMEEEGQEYYINGVYFTAEATTE